MYHAERPLVGQCDERPFRLGLMHSPSARIRPIVAVQQPCHLDAVHTSLGGIIAVSLAPVREALAMQRRQVGVWRGALLLRSTLSAQSGARRAIILPSR